MRKSHTLELYPSLVKRVGLLPALVLSKIFYWYSGRLRVKRKGQLWLAKSRAEMCEETGLSLDQQNRAIASLKHQGLIIVERGLFKNQVTPFIQLTKRGFELFEETKSLQSIVAEVPQPVVAELPQSIGAESPQSSTVLHDTKGTTATTTLGDYVAKPMHSKQVTELLQGKKGAKVPDNVLVKNAATLAMWWQRLVPYYHNLPVLEGGLKIKPLTHKEIGMLAKFLKAVGREHAYALMHWAIANWWQLTVSVKEAKGGGGASSTWPRVGYLLQHYDVVVGCYKKSQQPVAKVNSGLKMLSEAEQKAKLLVGK
jgi:hypothetical protein